MFAKDIIANAEKNTGLSFKQSSLPKKIYLDQKKN